MRRYLAFSLFTLFLLPAIGRSQNTTPHAPCPAWVGRVSGNTQQTFMYERVGDGAWQLVKKLTSESPLVADVSLGMMWDCGDPSDSEQYMLELFNRARANPDSEGIRLYNGATSDASLAASYQFFGTPTRDQVRSDFHGYQARPPLAMNKSILAAARAHSAKMIQVDSQYHDGPDGTPSSRMQSSGYTITGWSGEIVYAFGNDDLFYDEAVWQYDFGNPGLGHRENIMNFLDTTYNGGLHQNAMYTEAGIGIVHGSGSGGEHVGPVVSTGDFGEGQHYILGVVYNDLNHNGFYDLGEGIQGVTITATGASYSAVTTRSGGYAIPYKGSGSVTVTANGGGFSDVQKVMRFDGENIKVDFTPDVSSQVNLKFPPNDTLLSVSNPTFTWSAVPNAKNYRIQIDTSAKFSTLPAKMFANDSSLSGTTTSRAVTGLKDGITYYWRVQAKVGTSWAPYSAVQAFSVALPPPAVTLVAPTSGANFPASSFVTFVWNQATPRVENYMLVIADIATKQVVDYDTLFSGVADTSKSVDPNKFQSGKSYSWTVMARNDIGWSVNASPRTFTIGSAGVADDAYGFDVHVSPNPTVTRAKISFSLSIEESVVIRIFNSLGQDVAMENLGRLSRGAYSWTWDAKNYPAGSYYYELRTGDRLEAGRIQVVR